jgi:acyl-CoA thioester hydrolase
LTARADFPHLRPIATRWDDNDAHGHVNNVRYFAFFDTADQRLARA